MTGPEHYREAERLMDAAIGKPNGGDLVQLAQVHATLALAAAVGKSTDAVEVGREIAHQLNRTAATGRKGARS